MCVIIYNPRNAVPITEEELSEAWDANPDGAGFAVQMNGKVLYKRGFMEKQQFIEEVKKYIGVYNTLLHFRISTSKSINRLQCHPYKRTDVESLSGITNDSVICMNGIVSCDYTDRVKYNDTMNYIVDNPHRFKDLNQHVIDMIGNVTGSKWFVMKPNSIYKTSDFIEYEGRWYSNRNHEHYRDFYKLFDSYYDDPYDYKSYNYSNKKSYNYDDYYDYDNFDYDEYYYDAETNSYKFYESGMNIKERILEKSNDFFSKTMIKKLKKVKDGMLWEDINFFIKDFCLNKYSQCHYCDECFAELKTKNEIIKKVEDAYGFEYC